MLKNQIIQQILFRAYKIAFKLCSYLPKQEKTIIFESFHGKQFSDNPRAIYEYMKEHYPEYNLIWSADRRYTSLFEKKGLKYVTRLSIQWLLTMPRAKYWVVNTRLPLWIPKQKSTVYLQTWHGTPLKKLGIDIQEVHMPGTDTERYKRNFVNEAAKWDYLISPNAYSTEIFQRAFQFNKEMIESGYPRNDYLYNYNNEQHIQQLKNKLDLPPDKKIILYAPTWRDNEYYEKGKYKFNLHIDLEKLYKEFGDDYIVLFRMHYLVAEHLDLSGYNGFAYDFSDYEDIRDLYLISDLLITDYSSVFFDYANLKRPIIFFVYDIETYRDQLRGFYFSLEEEAPGPLVKTNEELIRAIKETEAAKPNVKLTSFYQRFCELEDGRASERVVKKLLS